MILKGPKKEKLSRRETTRNSNEETKKNKKRIIAFTLAISELFGVGSMTSGCSLEEKTYTIGSIAESSESKKGIEIKTPEGNVVVIDSDSPVIIDGQITEEETEYKIHVIDSNGNFKEGKTSGTNLVSSGIELTESELDEYDIYMVESDIGANVREGKTTESEKLAKVEHGEYIIAQKPKTKEYDGEWQKVIVIIDGKPVQAYIREDLLAEVIIEQEVDKNKRKVNTSRDGGVPLNLREKPRGTKVAEIPNGAIVEIIGKPVTEKGLEWSNISYTNEGGTVQKGWSASRYLEEPVIQQNINNIQLNANGTVTGIDVSGMRPEELRKFLQSELPQKIDAAGGTYNTSNIAGKSYFVYLKIGASSYGTGPFKQLESKFFIEQAKVCEELGVPWGFYYYTTAVTVAEAKKELDYIKNQLSKLGKTNYMMLPIAFDSEPSPSGHTNRRKGKDVTDCLVYLINEAANSGLGESIMYCGPRSWRNTSEKLFNLEKVISQTKGNLQGIWMCSLIDKQGQTKQKTKDAIAEIEAAGGKCIMLQVVIDGKTKNGLIDWNTADPEFIKENLGIEEFSDAEYTYYVGSPDDPQEELNDLFIGIDGLEH